MSGESTLYTVFASGCVATLYNVFAIEQRMIGKMSISELGDYCRMKSMMIMPEIAVFQWRRRVNNEGCVAYQRYPRVCRDMFCQMHICCMICDSREHEAFEICNGRVEGRCSVVQRMDNELQMLRNCWNVNSAELYHFFVNISQQNFNTCT